MKMMQTAQGGFGEIPASHERSRIRLHLQNLHWIASLIDYSID
jgi:hypothetical protein